MIMIMIDMMIMVTPSRDAFSQKRQQTATAGRASSRSMEVSKAAAATIEGPPPKRGGRGRQRGHGTAEGDRGGEDEGGGTGRGEGLRDGGEGPAIIIYCN